MVRRAMDENLPKPSTKRKRVDQKNSLVGRTFFVPSSLRECHYVVFLPSPCCVVYLINKLVSSHW